MTTMPKRVAGGGVVMAKKKKKQQQQRIGNASAAPVIRDGSISAANDNIGTDPSSSASTSHRCQSSAPSQIIRRDDELPANANDNNNHEFDDVDDDDDDDDNEVLDASDIPNDALLCLQAYTRPMNSETCAYVPIFTKQLLSSIESSSAASGQTRPEILEDDDDIDEFNDNNAGGKSMDVVEKSTHAAPMLPKLVLLHHLVNTASSSTSTSASSRAHAERAITQLALSNDVRLLQLHGTAISTSLSSTSSWRGDGNDDDDVVVMETSVYVDAAQMALQTYYFGQHSTLPCNDDAHRRHQSTTPATATSTMNTMDKETTILFHWFTNALLPYFAGRTWFSSSALNSLFHHQHHYCQNPPQYCTANDDDLQMTKKRKYNHTSNDLPSGNNSNRRQGMHNTTNHREHYTYSLKQMEQMIQQLVHAGLLLPRRRCGDCDDDDDGYWFSLPGLGKAAKSIVDGRTNLLRRLQASRYKEKKRSVLEHDINEKGRRQRTALNNTSGGKGNKNVVEQTGEFIVLDLLSKGWIRIHETSSTGEQFVRLS